MSMDKESVERLQERVTELERANDNLLRALGAVVHRCGGVVKVSKGSMYNDYKVHESEDPVTGSIRIKSEVI